MSDKESPAPELATLLYAGAVFDKEDGKVFHKYLHIESYETTEHGYVDGKLANADPWAFGKKLSHGQPGHVFTIHKTPGKEGSVKMGTNEFVGLWNDPAQRASWQAQSSANESLATRSKEVEKLLAKRDDKMLLDPYRAAYWKLSAAGRRHLLAEVVRYITGGKE